MQDCNMINCYCPHSKIKRPETALGKNEPGTNTSTQPCIEQTRDPVIKLKAAPPLPGVTFTSADVSNTIKWITGFKLYKIQEITLKSLIKNHPAIINSINDNKKIALIHSGGRRVQMF